MCGGEECVCGGGVCVQGPVCDVQYIADSPVY